MDSKLCRGCQTIKPYSDYGKEKRSGIGIKSRCKDCCNLYYRNKYASFRESKIDSAKAFYERNKDKVLAKAKGRYNCSNAKKRKYEYNKVYRQNNKTAINVKTREYIRNKRRTDERFRISILHRSMVKELKRASDKKTNELLGYTYSQLIDHIGRDIKFSESIDHKIPISWFKKSAPIKIVHDLNNLQFMCKIKNSTKNNRYADSVPFEYYSNAIAYIKEQYKNKVRYDNTN
jgi:hypothetical protein